MYLLQSLQAGADPSTAAALSPESAPTDPHCLPPQSDLLMGDPELPLTSITSSDPHHHDDRTRSFQLAHNIHILPHLPKYSIIIQKKSNELLGKLLQGKSYKGRKGEGRENFPGQRAVCVVSSEPNPKGSEVGLASSPLGSPLCTRWSIF